MLTVERPVARASRCRSGEGREDGLQAVTRIARGRSYRHALAVLLADGGYARVVLARPPAFDIGRLVDTVGCELVVVPPERFG